MRVGIGYDIHPFDPNRPLVIGGVRIYNLYVPNGTALGTEAFAYKLQWLERLRLELDASARADEPLLLCGDFNIAPDARDLVDPAAPLPFASATTAPRRALRGVRVARGTAAGDRAMSWDGLRAWFGSRGGLALYAEVYTL